MKLYALKYVAVKWGNLLGMLINLLEHYGYWVLFFALLLEMLALPLPGELLMSYAGLAVFEGKLNWLLCIVAAGTGTSLGITLSYWIGYQLGTPFFEKYGTRVHLGTDKLDMVSKWYQKYGYKVLIIAYFIPGVRHITGYFSGTTKLSFRKYAIFAYSGAFFWVSVFILLGELLGPKWEQYHHKINMYMIIFGVILVGIFIGIYMYRNYRNQIKDKLLSILSNGLVRYNSIRKIKVIIICAFASLVLFFTLLIGLIEDFLAHEFALFDEVGSYMIHQIFNSSWKDLMNRFALLGSYYVFVPIVVLAIGCMWMKSKVRLLEMSFLAVVIVGGKVLIEGLHLLFLSISPTTFNFPSEQTFNALTVYGFTAYLLGRHFRDVKTRITLSLVVIVICLLVGISSIFLNIQYPSDVSAGYLFGGTWISLNVILLEIFRLMQKYKSAKA